MTEEIKNDLDLIWGPWARRADGAALDYPREVPIGRCMREGPGAGQGGFRGIPDNPAAERLEAAIVAMGDPFLIRMIRWRHAQRVMVKDIAKRIRRSTQTASGYLSRAYRLIGYHLE